MMISTFLVLPKIHAAGCGSEVGTHPRATGVPSAYRRRAPAIAHEKAMAAEFVYEFSASGPHGARARARRCAQDGDLESRALIADR